MAISKLAFCLYKTAFHNKKVEQISLAILSFTLAIDSFPINSVGKSNLRKSQLRKFRFILSYLIGVAVFQYDQAIENHNSSLGNIQRRRIIQTKCLLFEFKDVECTHPSENKNLNLNQMHFTFWFPVWKLGLINLSEKSRRFKNEEKYTNMDLGATHSILFPKYNFTSK